MKTSLLTIATATALLASASGFTQNNSGIPVQDGKLAQVIEVGLITTPPSGSRPGSEVHAVVEYLGLCNIPTSFVVMKTGMFQYSIVEARTPVSSTNIPCSAHTLIKQEIIVANIPGPTPELDSISVNGIHPQ